MCNSSTGWAVIGVITLALLFGLLAFYQLRKVSILGSKKRINAYIILGGVCFITSLLSLLSLIQNISAFSAPKQSIGTVDSTIDNLNALIIPSFGFGFLLGLSILFLGYALLEYKASGMTHINNIPA